MCDRPSASIKLDMSRPVLIAHRAPAACIWLISFTSCSGMGGVSNSEKIVPSKSVEINLMGKSILSVSGAGLIRGASEVNVA